MMRRHPNSLATMLGSFGFTPMTILRIYSNQNITHECVYRYRINTSHGILLKNKTLSRITNNSHYRDSFQPTIASGKLVLYDLTHLARFFYDYFVSF